MCGGPQVRRLYYIIQWYLILLNQNDEIVKGFKKKTIVLMRVKAKFNRLSLMLVNQFVKLIEIIFG